MRCLPGAAALLRSIVLGVVLVAAARPGTGPSLDPGGRPAAAPSPAAAHVMAPLLGKRWW
jgi:hypothetical protein